MLHESDPEPWLVDALVAALARCGCPPAVASSLAAEARVGRDDGSGEASLGLLGFWGSFVDPADPDDPDEWHGATEFVALNVANLNAELTDRRNRGEVDGDPLWPVSRPPRR